MLTELDALVVGAGFGGIYQLWKLRNEGYRTKLVEAGSDFGGVWHRTCYPGARVDSAMPYYQFSMPELWKDWTWTERFPGWEELQKYFAHVDDKLKLREDTYFNTFITNATFDKKDNKWLVATKYGDMFKARYLLLNTGFAANRYVPEFKGLDTFKGEWIHPSHWPKEGLDVAGKRVAIIGTGSTGLQLAQEISKSAKGLTVFQRTPNLAIPMRQESYPNTEFAQPEGPKSNYPAIFAKRKETFTGFAFNFIGRNTFDDSPKQRAETYEALWKEGDFQFWVGTYQDALFVDESNTEAYNFWRDKTRARINDLKLKDMLAPVIKPHAFGCKRVSLENGYFEIYNRENVNLVDINATPIIEIIPWGIQTTEKEHEFDFIVIATGYDAISGGLTQIDIRGLSGQSLADEWAEGITTYLGMSVGGFPNMFFTYGPQSPTALCNGPTCAELQGDWIVRCLNYMREKNLSSIEPTVPAEVAWAKDIASYANASLLPGTKSWYMGDNIPGKHRECLLYLGGVDRYHEECRKSAADGYAGFVLG